MEEVNKDTLEQKILNLQKQYKKRLMLAKVIFLICAYILLIGGLVAITLLLKKYGIENTSITTVVASSVAVSLLYASTPICLRYSKKLQALKQEITDLNSLLEPMQQPKEFEEITATNNKEDLNLPPIKQYTPTKREKIATYVGVGIIFIAFIFMFVLMSAEKYMPVPLFIGLLILMFWLYAYGMFLAISNRWVYSLYYPTVCMLLLATPPCLTALITHKFAEWILILSTCLAGVVAIILFCIFLYFNITMPNKQRKKYLEQNKPLIIEDRDEDGDINWFNQNGDMATIVRYSQFKCFASVYKNQNDQLTIYKQERFIDYQSALYFVYKNLIELDTIKLDSPKIKSKF